MEGKIARRRTGMVICDRKKRLSHIVIFSIILLLAACASMNVFFCCQYDFRESSEKTAAIETRTSQENIADDDNSHDARSITHITRGICPIPMAAVVPKGFSLLLVLIIDFLFFLFTLFIILPDRQTLIHQKVRQDN